VLPDLACEPNRGQVRKGRDALAQIIEVRRKLARSPDLARAVDRRLEPAFDVLRTVFGSRPVRRAIAVIDSPWR
jgi:hypothetical protein